MRKVESRDWGWRQRQVVLSPLDQRAYSEHLRAAFPDIQFVDDPWPARGEYPPDLRVHESLDTCLADRGYLLFDRGWTPTWKTYDDPTLWYLVNFPVPYGTFERGGEVSRWQGGPENMIASLIGVMIEMHHKGDLSVARKVLRLLDKVIADGPLETVSYPSLETLGPVNRKSWIGKDAYSWSLEAPDRILGREGHMKVAVRAAR